MRVPALTRARLLPAMALGYAVFCLLYLGSHALRLGAPLELQRSGLDAALPLLPASIWIYLSQFVLLPLSLCLVRDTAIRSRLFYACLLATLGAATVFLCWPTRLLRPEIPVDGLTGLAWQLLFASDVDGNCFPSLHVALATLCGFALWRHGWRGLALLWPAAIALATLTTWQHVSADVIGGALLAVLAWWAEPRLLRHD